MGLEEVKQQIGFSYIGGKMAIKLLNKILGHTIVSLARVGLFDTGEHVPLMDTLLFTLADGRRFELLTEQTETLFKEVSTMLFAGFELEPDEILVETCLNEEINIDLPLFVTHLTEIWAHSGTEKFVVAIILRDATRQLSLSICTESDEIELLSIEELQHRVMSSMRFYYPHLESHNYSTKPHPFVSPMVNTIPTNGYPAREAAVHLKPVAVAQPYQELVPA